MPIHPKYLPDFIEHGIFHVYNRTNNKEKLFLSNENRLFFLKRFKDILSPFVDTYCWNLLPNHFHLLIKIKSGNDINSYLQNKPAAELTFTEKKYLHQQIPKLPTEAANVGTPTITFSVLIERTFKRFVQSYALAFNEQHNRKGNLFYKPFKRVKIETDAQFTMAIIYTHANAIKHGLVKDFTKHKWSSWHSIVSNQPSSILREEIIEWFGNLENCIKAHHDLVEYYYDCDVAIDD